MEILTNDNNEYFGLITDYKNAYGLKDAIVEEYGAEGTLSVIATIHMRPLTDHELSEEGDYSTYDPGHWIPVDVPCETSDVFYHAVETDIPVLEETVQPDNVMDDVLDDKLDDESPHNNFVFHDNDGTEEDDDYDTEEDESLYQ